jgi:hypothetical protein
MNITYTWLVKHLTADMRGYATIGFFEMQGTDENGNTANGSVTVCFGGDSLKPMSQWTQETIDAYAETKRADIEEIITTALTARITALENK